MDFQFDYQMFESPLVGFAWQTWSDARGGSFMSAAAAQCEMVITRYRGELTVHVRGPETKASPAPIPEEAEFLGITFKLGTFMPHLPTETLVDGDALLPLTAGERAFWLNGSAWEVPTFDNADVFVRRLERQGLIARDPVVDAALAGRAAGVSPRSLQRRFLRATGLTHGAIAQIERAREAMTLLQRGRSILDVVAQAGYADQPHLTRSLKYYVGHTPAQLAGVK